MQLYDLRREAGNAQGAQLVGRRILAAERRRFHESCLEPWARRKTTGCARSAGYWSMAASFVLHGALNEELFIQPAVSGEMFLVFAKVHPFLKELREKMGDPHMFGNIEKVITDPNSGVNG